MKEQKILVLGGKGKTGRRVVERLTNLGYSDVRIGSRSAVPSFDWEDEATWPAVMKGIDSVYITFQPDLAIPSALETIQKFTALASDTGITKMVLLSGRGEKEAQVCERVVMNTAQRWTIVRASWFNQNFSESFFFDPILAGEIALPRGGILEPFIDADDIADVVVESLTDSKHDGQIYELTGPRLLTFRQAITEISQATGRDIHFRDLTLEENVDLMRSHRLPEDYIGLVDYLFAEILDGRNSSVTDDVERVLGRKAREFSEYVKATAERGVWHVELSEESGR